MQHWQKWPKYEESEKEIDMKVINLSSFPLALRHINLLRKGMYFLPTNTMDEFNVYKDIALFLRKVFLWYTDPSDTTITTDSRDDEILQILNSLLEKNDEQVDQTVVQKRHAPLKFRSNKMPPLYRNK